MAINGEYIVSINCITYNQSAYITDTLNGFTIQQTSFPFVAVVMDDASNDGEQVVIRSYVDEYFDHSDETGYKQWETDDAYWTFARHKENVQCYLVVAYLKRNLFREPEKKEALVKEWMNAKYMALCEGDDYWTDPLKLQKQVDFMETHENCSCYAHNSLTLNTNTRQIGLFNNKLLHTKDYSLEPFILRDWFTPTQSLLYRRDSYQAFEDKPVFMHGDYSLLLNVLLPQESYLHYENDIMSVYRDGGWASTHYNEIDLYNDFISLLEYFKQKSNHRCDAIFDKQIERQRLELEQYVKYQKEFEKAHVLFVRVGHWLCRTIASIINKYVSCIQVTKKIVPMAVPNLEQLD